MTQALPFKPGDLAVESVGSIIRFWSIRDSAGAERLAFDCRAESRTIARHRYLFRTDAGDEGEKALVPAPELTSARLYPRKPERWPDAARIVRETLGAPPTATVHFFYSSWGPSGAYWNMPNRTGDTHRSIPGTEQEDSKP